MEGGEAVVEIHLREESIFKQKIRKKSIIKESYLALQ